ncbi:hypothetical protein R3P38DRAFT_2432008, partial [Favolaschia claudopus]
HPIRLDYDNWVGEGSRSKKDKGAETFADQFFDLRILPGDASFIEAPVQRVLNIIFPPRDDPEFWQNVNLDLRRYLMTVTPILFQLVILRLYLRRPASDDLQIYFLSRYFTRKELIQLEHDDPYADAKEGSIVRNLTTPEIVLNTPENNQSGLVISYQFSKIRIKLSTSAAAHIPPSFELANAFSIGGNEYVWRPSDSP